MVVLRKIATRLRLAETIAEPLCDKRDPCRMRHSYAEMAAARMMMIAATALCSISMTPTIRARAAGAGALRHFRRYLRQAGAVSVARWQAALKDGGRQDPPPCHQPHPQALA